MAVGKKSDLKSKKVEISFIHSSAFLLKGIFVLTTECVSAVPGDHEKLPVVLLPKSMYYLF